MKVFIASHSSRAGGGISVARNLISAFGRIAPENEYFFTIPPDLAFEECCTIAPQQRHLTYKHTGPMKRWLWETRNLPILIREFQPDVLFNMGNRGLTKCHCPQATFIQDSHLFYPPAHYGAPSLRERLLFAYHKRHLRKSLSSTQLLFCQTPVGERRLRDVYGDHFEVRPYATPCPIPSGSDDLECPETLNSSNMKNAFKLFVPAAYYPHKNLEMILQLFEKHRDRLQDVVVVLTLSDQNPRAAKLATEIKRRRLDSHIINVGVLNTSEVARYYANTDALLMPTLLETFCLPYVEAMQFGRPILTSDLDFAHEVCGEAALFFDPWDADDICKAILRLKDDKALHQQLVDAGKNKHSQSSSWDETARLMMRDLKTLGKSGDS